jgi:hypothetical protein
MKLKAALIFVVAVMLLGLSAWSQDTPKVEISLDYSFSHFQAVDYEQPNYFFGQYFDLEGGGGGIVYNFRPTVGFKAEFQGYTSNTRPVTVPPGYAYLPQGGTANVSGDLFTYMFGPEIGKTWGHFRPFAEVLAGGAHSNVWGNALEDLDLTGVTKSASNNAFAGAAGFGLDIGVSRHLSLRPLEVDFLYTNFNSHLKLSDNQESWRYLGGLVFTFGGKPPTPPTATCSATPATVMVGEPVTVTATGTNFNPKHSLTYAWAIAGGKLSSVDKDTSTVDTTGLSEGTYTANATITDPKGPKNYNVSHCGANFNVNVPHNPPQVTCSASPTAVKPGETSTITASATSPDKSNITGYTYSASSGTVDGSGTTATLTTSPQASDTVSVTVTATDARGLTGNCTAAVSITAPPPPTVTCVSIEDWGQCTFEKNPKKPWRVDNDCKDTLDKLSLKLQQTPSGKVEIVGYTNEQEVVTEQTLGGQRAVNVKYYLTTEGPNKSDASRIQPRQGGNNGQAAHFFYVPDGMLCSGQTEDGTVVDETAIQGQSRSAPAPKHKHKAAAPAEPAAPPAQ